MADAFKEINFKFDDDPSANTEVVIHRKQRRPNPPPQPIPTTREEEDFRRNCRLMNTSTPKKPSQSDVKLAMNSARSSFFGLDDSNYDEPPRRDSQMDTAEMLANCTGGGGAGDNDADSQESYRSCDINNNQQEKRNSGGNKESESGLGSISAASDEPDSKSSPEKALLLENVEGGGAPVPMPRNIIREPQYYHAKNHPNPSQVSGHIY